jgi:uncharacterized protein YjbI with pentapeptide repeats
MRGIASGRFAAALVAVAVVPALAWVLVVVPREQARGVVFEGEDAAAKSATLINEYRRTLAQAIGGLFVVIGGISGAFFTYRQLTLAREAQITDRFTKAVAQLGDDTLAVRLGGIYALERIAKDSPRDYWTFVEVLSAFVRTNAPVTTSALPELAAVGFGGVQAPPTDIQAILTVLGRRHREGERGVVDLRRTVLAGAQLGHAHLANANLMEAHLEGAMLSRAHLEGAELFKAHLGNADLSDARLEGAMLREANLERAWLTTAHLERADIRYAHLEGADLRRAHLEEANLTRAHLDGAHLGDAYLQGADLSDAHLERAILLEAHLEGANLASARGITVTQLSAAFVDETTTLPDGIALTDLMRSRGHGQAQDGIK